MSRVVSWRMVGAMAVATCSVAASVSAGETWMTETEIRDALAGKVIDGHYRNGRTFTETYLAGGRISYTDQVRSSGGRWSLVNGSFCTIYDGDSSGGCFRVHRAGSNCFEFYFVARTEEQALKPGDPSWTARGWLKDVKSTCVDGAAA